MTGEETRPMANAPAPDLGTHLYWIRPDGTKVECSTHEATAAEELGIETDAGSYQASNLAWAQGWIRVSADVGEFGCDPAPATPVVALRALARLIRELPDFATYYVGSEHAPDKRSALIALHCQIRQAEEGTEAHS